jgi:hypothetical protein
MASGNSLPIRTGKFTSNGAARTIETPGFRPKMVRFINATNAAHGLWLDTMPDGYVHTQEGGTAALATSNGVTPLAEGFTLGTNAVLNTTAEVIHWVAQG